MKVSCDDDFITSTFHALSDTSKIHAKLEEVAAELSRDLTEGQWTGKTITLKYKLDTFKSMPPSLFPSRRLPDTTV